jgi:hypothetical protein
MLIINDLNNPQSAFSSRTDEIPAEGLSEDEAELISMVHVGKNAAPARKWDRFVSVGFR